MSATSTTGGELAACRGVTVVHGRGAAAVKALTEVDFAIATGARIALLGRSGSGKTTLLHVLGGLIEPTRGEVSLAGEALSSLDAAARGRVRARSVAYVFQGANLLPTFTAFENVAFALLLAGGEGESSYGNGDDRLGAADLLELVGLSAKLDALPGELSGGEAGRVAIARALAQHPALMLCDEPTGQLDSDTGGRVLDLIDALHERLGFALVIATHDSEVASRATRVVTLDDGRIVSDEEPS
jgi:predicted ABC-type transport system involved in lysophospholipase L1 biosynthesis ATPase subunit